MKTSVFTLSLLWPSYAGAYGFQAPVQLKGGDEPIKTQSPGYAAPCLHDLDGDLDMLSGGAGGEVVWSENSAGEGKSISPGKFETLTTGTKIPTKKARQERNKKRLSTMTSAGNSRRRSGSASFGCIIRNDFS